MSLQDICRNALMELGSFEVPSTFYGNTNLTARQCVALVQREGQTLVRERRWAELIADYTITTVEGQTTYSLPADFHSFASMSQWDRSFHLPMIGPTTGANWQWLKSGISTATTINRWWRLRGQYFEVHPVPPASGETLAFDYYSKNWISYQTPVGEATTGITWSSDNDTALISEDLLTLGLKWRFLQAKGMPFEAEYKEYESMKDAHIEDNGGKGIIQLGKQRIVLTNLPDTGFGRAE